jgi:hypothetical protein
MVRLLIFRNLCLQVILPHVLLFGREVGCPQTKQSLIFEFLFEKTCQIFLAITTSSVDLTRYTAFNSLGL